MQIVRRKSSVHEIENSSYPPIVNRILQNRGVRDIGEVNTKAKFLEHYKSLKDIDTAANLLANAVINQQKIVIVGDFDADGATSTALCVLALNEMGHQNVDYIVPNRFDFGYGLTAPVVDLALEKNADLILTVDNGISSFDGVQYAKEKGLLVIVSDHHLASEHIPNADAIVNPNQPGCCFPSKNLAGVGVAFYLMSALKNGLNSRNYYSDRGLRVPNMAEFLDIVAIGTVADVVALDKNNRILVQQGIMRIRSGATRPGVLALFSIANRSHKKCCSSDLGFVVGPRLNAAGRLEDMSAGIECLITQSPEKAKDYAFKLHNLNQSRKEIEQTMKIDAQRALDAMSIDDQNLPSAIVVYNTSFHQGVVGIVAGKLKEQYYRPTIVFADEDSEYIKGSARSIEGSHIRDVLANIDALQPGLIKKFGGHAMAAGLSLKRENLDRFETLFVKAVEEQNNRSLGLKVIHSDGELDAHDISLENAHSIKYSLPWGQHFEAPVFDGYFDIVSQRIVGEKHLKLVLSLSHESEKPKMVSQRYYIDAIAFNVDTTLWPDVSVKRIKAAYRLDINEFNNDAQVQLIIVDLCPS